MPRGATPRHTTPRHMCRRSRLSPSPSSTWRSGFYSGPCMHARTRPHAPTFDMLVLNEPNAAQRHGTGGSMSIHISIHRCICSMVFWRAIGRGRCAPARPRARACTHLCVCASMLLVEDGVCMCRHMRVLTCVHMGMGMGSHVHAHVRARACTLARSLARSLGCAAG